MSNPYHHSENPAASGHETNIDTGNRPRRLNRNGYTNEGIQDGKVIPERNSYRQDTDRQPTEQNAQPSGRQRRLQSQYTSSQLPLTNAHGQTTDNQYPIKGEYSQTTGGQMPIPNGFSQSTGSQNRLQSENRQATGEQNPLQNGYYQNTGSQRVYRNGAVLANGQPERKRPLSDWQKTDPALRPVSSWQKSNETMSGFSRDDVDPSIAQDRSPNLYDKDNSFWNKDPNHIAKDDRQNTQSPQTKPYDGKRLIKVIAVLILLLVAGALITRFTIFNVSEITVKGNSAYSAEDIIRWSNVKIGMNLLSVNEKDVKNSLESVWHIELDYVEKGIPGHVTIAVKERKPVAYFKDLGIYYTVDQGRMVLDMSEVMDKSQFDGLLELKGLSLKDARVGLKLQLSNEKQGLICESLIREIRVMQSLSLIQEIDLSDLNSIRLVTADRYTVVMGDDRDIHAKLRAMTLVREKLISMGLQEGTIDVSEFEHPFYIPSV